MKSYRLLWADIIRIIAIYLVLVVHNTRLEIPTNTQNLFTLVSFAVAKTCVPLFIMLSGALLLIKREGYVSFYKKRASRYLIPWLFWSVITAIIFFLKDKTDIYAGFITYFKQGLLSYWFLPMLTCLYLLTPTLRRFLHSLNKSEITYFIILWFLSVSLLPFTINSPAFPLFIDNSLLTQTIRYSGYYLIGYIITIFDIDKRYSSKLFVVGFIAGIGFVILPTLNRLTNTLYFDYHSPGIIIGSVCGYILIKNIMVKFSNILTKSTKFITVLSQASFGIYLVHLIIKNVATDYMGISFFANKLFPLNFVNSIALFIISFSVIFILKKLPLLGKIVG